MRSADAEHWTAEDTHISVKSVSPFRLCYIFYINWLIKEAKTKKKKKKKKKKKRKKKKKKKKKRNRLGQYGLTRAAKRAARWRESGCVMLYFLRANRERSQIYVFFAIAEGDLLAQLGGSSGRIV